MRVFGRVYENEFASLLVASIVGGVAGSMVGWTYSSCANLVTIQFSSLPPVSTTSWGLPCLAEQTLRFVTYVGIVAFIVVALFWLGLSILDFLSSPRLFRAKSGKVGKPKNRKSRKSRMP